MKNNNLRIGLVLQTFRKDWNRQLFLKWEHYLTLVYTHTLPINSQNSQRIRFDI
jgi:hypothetical protein